MRLYNLKTHTYANALAVDCGGIFHIAMLTCNLPDDCSLEENTIPGITA